MAKKSKSKSKRTSKSRTSRKGLIAGLSIGGVVALIIGALVVMYFMGVFDDLFKKKSKPRVDDKKKSTVKLVNVPGFIDGQTDETQPVLLGSGTGSLLDTFKKKQGEVTEPTDAKILLDNQDKKYYGYNGTRGDSFRGKTEIFIIDNKDPNVYIEFKVIQIKDKYARFVYESNKLTAYTPISGHIQINEYDNLEYIHYIDIQKVLAKTGDFNILFSEELFR